MCDFVMERGTMNVFLFFEGYQAEFFKKRMKINRGFMVPEFSI